MDVEIVVLPQLAAGSIEWHEAGHVVGSRGKGESVTGTAVSHCYCQTHHITEPQLKCY